MEKRGEEKKEKREKRKEGAIDYLSFFSFFFTKEHGSSGEIYWPSQISRLEQSKCSIYRCENNYSSGIRGESSMLCHRNESVT